MEFALASKTKAPALIHQQHSNDRSSDLEPNRRRLLMTGVASIVAASLPGWLLHAQSTLDACSPAIPQDHAPSNGGSCPYPIPWLDKNGNHNQSPMPNVELSNIYHFKGKAGTLQRLPRHRYG